MLNNQINQTPTSSHCPACEQPADQGDRQAILTEVDIPGVDGSEPIRVVHTLSAVLLCQGTRTVRLPLGSIPELVREFRATGAVETP